MKSGSSFRLINKSGKEVSPGERGLLLYKNGTVCSTGFSNHSANAVCSEMGYKRAVNWTTGYDHDYDQERFDVKLRAVNCSNDDWGSCNYSVSSDCEHNEDIFLTCDGW